MWRWPGQAAAPDDFRQKRFGRGIAMQDVVLAALFVIDDELHRDIRAARPLGVGRVAAIADHVAGVGRIHSSLVASCSPLTGQPNLPSLCHFWPPATFRPGWRIFADFQPIPIRNNLPT